MQEKPNEADLRLIKELLFQVDNLFHTRFNFFIVVEAIFYTALGQVWSAADGQIKVFVCTLALVNTILLWFPLLRLQKRQSWLIREFKGDPTFKKYSDINRWVPSTWLILAWIIPVVSLLSWGIVVYMIKQDYLGLLDKMFK